MVKTMVKTVFTLSFMVLLSFPPLLAEEKLPYTPDQTPSGLADTHQVVIILESIFSGNCLGTFGDPKFHLVIEAFKVGEKHAFAINIAALKRIFLGKVPTNTQKSLYKEIKIPAEALNEALSQIEPPILGQNETNTSHMTQILSPMGQAQELEKAGLRLNFYQTGYLLDDHLGFFTVDLPTPLIAARQPQLTSSIYPGKPIPFSIHLKSPGCAKLNGIIDIR